jgi:nucleotide-binding universal stress UspA family protein
MNNHNILFATDFSDRDNTAFSVACDLALKASARLVILHVQDPRYEALSKSTRKDPKAEFARYLPTDYAVNFDHVLRVGDADEQILQFAEANDTDLIILGTHGRSGLSRAFAGSVAEKVLRNGNTPVMTIRDAAQNLANHDLLRILVPIDFSVYGHAALDYATKLALSVSAEICIVHVEETDAQTPMEISDDPSQYSGNQSSLWQQLTKFVPPSRKVNFTHRLLAGDAATVISDYAKLNNFDFIVLGTHGRSGFSRAILGSVAESVVRQSDCPVISVKPSNKRTGVLS